jgi:Ig-like domain CHU_C associated/HYR domain
MKKLLLFLFISAGVFAQDTLRFEQPSGTKTWTEGGVTWNFVGGVDEIRTTNPKSGLGHGYTVSGNSGVFESSQNLNVQGVWLKHSQNVFQDSKIQGYDYNDSLIYTVMIPTINFSNSYSYLSLNWSNIKKIKFTVFPYQGPGPPPNFLPEYILTNLFFDDLIFSISPPQGPDTTPPTITCLQDTSACYTFTVPNFADMAVATDAVSGTNVTKIQSIPVGTVLIGDTTLTVTATDQAGNNAYCNVQIKVNKATSSIQNITSNLGFQDLSGGYHFVSGSFQNTIPNAKGCDSLITTNLTISQQLNILNFETIANTTNWTEDARTWSWNGSTDIIGNGIFAKTGIGYGKASSNTTSKLVFPINLNLSNMWIRPQTNGSMNPFYATLYGYDAAGNVLYTKNIDPILSYHNLTLNWQNVKSIGFNVPMGQVTFPGPPGPGGTPGPNINTPISQDIYYDDLSYTLYSTPIDIIPPTIFCINSNQNGFCNSYIVPDLRNNLMVSDNISQLNAIVKTQSIIVGTVLTKDSLITFTATDEAGNTASCSYIIKINKNTTSTQNVTANTSFKDIQNVYHYASGTFTATIPNSKGCDSVITYNLTLNQIPNILNFDVAPNLTTWTEDGNSWSWNGPNDKIAGQTNANTGIGAGVASSGTSAKLVFPVHLNISTIWISGQSNGSMLPISGEMKGYDASGSVLYTLQINQTAGFENKILNWQNVKSIGFTVPMGQMMSPGGPGMPGGNMPISMDIFYDEMAYSIYSTPIDSIAPIITCANTQIVSNSCDTYALPDLTIGNTVSDNMTSPANITITQSVAAGTIINSDTFVKIIATDLAGNKDSCTVLIKVKKSTISNQFVTANTSFKDAAGVFNYVSGVFSVNIPNSIGCDSLITYNLTINQVPNVLNFDVAPNLTTWNEDSKTWIWDSSTDKIGNGIDAKAGNGYGWAKSNTTSKLLFQDSLNLSNIWVKYIPNSMFPQPALINAYNASGGIIYTKSIMPSYNYQNIILSWVNVSSIGFSVPMGSVPDPGGPGMPPGGTLQVSQNLFYDEMGYSEVVADTIKPIINCIGSVSLCQNTIFPNLSIFPSSYFTVSDNIGIVSVVQNPIVGTLFNIAQNDSLKLYFKATDFSGNKDSCFIIVKPKLKSYASVSVTGCNNYYSPSGKIYTQTGIYKDTIQNAAGCDSIITINLNINEQFLPSNITANKTNICYGDLVTFRATCPAGSNLEWFRNIGPGSTLSTVDSIKLNVYDNFILNVRCNGPVCTGNSIRVIGSDFMNSSPLLSISFLPPNPILPSNFTSTKSNICNGELVTLSANCPSGFNIIWDFGSSSLIANTLTLNLFDYTIVNARCGGQCGGVSVNVIGSSNPILNIAIDLGKPRPTVTYNPFNGCEGDTLIIRASGCNTDSVYWSNGMVGDSLILFPTSSFYLSAKCSRDSCSQSSYPIYFSVYTLIKPILTSSHPTNITCRGSNIQMTVTGCASGQAMFSNGNQVYSNYIINLFPLESTSYKVRCLDNQCNYSNAPYSDSIYVEIVADSIKAPILDSSRSFICLRELTYHLSNSCPNGQVYWKINNSDVTSASFSWYAPINNDDSLTVWCRYYDCLSDTVTLKAKLNYPKPVINSSQSNFCSGKIATFNTLSCPLPFSSPVWRIFNNNDVLTATYGGSTISVALEMGSKISLSCGRNGSGGFYCESDTALFIPNFLNNNLITNIQISANNLCPGSAYAVTYALGSTFPVANRFTVQLSDANGSFINPIIIGTSTSANQLSVPVTIPNNIVWGYAYKIRVVPSITNLGTGPFLCYESTDNILISGKNVIQINLTANSVCEGSSVQLISNVNATAPYSYTINWYKNGSLVDSLNQKTEKKNFFRYYVGTNDIGLYKVKYTRLSDGCILYSDTIRVTIGTPNLPPVLADTIVNINRGVSTNFNASCAAAGQLIWSKSPYTFYSNYNLYSSGSTTIFGEAKYYLACKQGNCISDFRYVNVKFNTQAGAPLSPVLSVANDNICRVNGPNSLTQIVTATGCAGSVRWSSDPNFSFVFSTTSGGTHTFENQPGFRIIYADCILNGIYSKNYSNANLTTYSLPSYPVIPPFESLTSYNNQEININVSLNSDVLLKTSELRTIGSGEFYPNCVGVTNWYNSAAGGTILGSGSTFSQSNVTTDFTVYVSCTSVQGCEGLRKKVIVNVDPINPLILPVRNKYDICGSGTATLQASGCEANGIKWSSDAAGSNILTTGGTFITPSFSNTSDTNLIVKYYVKCVKNTLSSAVSTIDVIVSPLSNVPIVADTVFACNAEITRVNIPKGCNPKFERTIWLLEAWNIMTGISLILVLTHQITQILPQLTKWLVKTNSQLVSQQK